MVGPDVLRQVKLIELRTRRLVTTLFSGEYRSVFRGQGIEFAEVRAYEQGDDFRAIDWNVSARMGTPYVKTFEEAREERQRGFEEARQECLRIESKADAHFRWTIGLLMPIVVGVLVIIVRSLLGLP